MQDARHIENTTHAITSRGLALAARVISGASVRWVDCQPDTCQRVYFANHTSHLDAIVLWSSLPTAVRQVVRPVAAKDYWERGAVRRYLAKTFKALLIDRTKIKVHQSPVDLMIREIGDTYSLIVFPEATRSVPGEPMRLQRGAAQIALEADAALEIVHFSCKPVFLSKRDPWYRVPPVRPCLAARVGASLRARDFQRSGETRSVAARHLTLALEHELSRGIHLGVFVKSCG